MQQVSSTFLNIISGDFQVEERITINDVIYTSSDIVGTPARQESLFDEFGVGNVIASCLEFTLKTSNTIPRGAEVLFEVRVKNGSETSEWIEKGTFFIQKRSANVKQGLISFECYDTILKSDVVYWKTGTWADRTAYQVMQEIAEVMGCSVESATATLISGTPMTITVPPAVGDGGTTCREMLSYIASNYAGNFIVDDLNQLKLVRFTSSSPYVLGGNISTFSNTPSFSAVDRVIVYMDSEHGYYAPASGFEELTGKIVEVENPYGTQAMANAILTALTGYVYQPYSVEGALLPPHVEIGDRLTVNTGSGSSTLTGLAADITSEYDSLLVCTIKAPGTNDTDENEYPYGESQEKSIMAKIKGIETYISVLPGQILSRVAGEWAPEYDSSETYMTGDYVIYGDKYYICLEDYVTGDWDSTKWQESAGTDITESQIDVSLDSITIGISDDTSGSKITLTKDGIEFTSATAYFKTNNAHFDGILSADKVEVAKSIRFDSNVYGACTDSASTSAKTVSCSDYGNVTLEDGMIVRVSFDNACEVENPTLNVQNTGAKTIKVNNMTYAAYNAWKAKEVVTFTYRIEKNVGYWCMESENNCLVSGTSASTQTKEISNVTGFTYSNGTKVRVKFTYSNTYYPPYLKIGSGGSSLPIYLNGYPCPATAWGAGEVVELTFNSYAGTSGAWYITSSASAEAQGISLDVNLYGTCSTIASAGTKEVTCNGFTALSIKQGVSIKVAFTFGNTDAYPNIRINEINATSAPLIVNGMRNAARSAWKDGEVVTLTYVVNNNVGYWSMDSSTNVLLCTTGAAYQTKAVDVTKISGDTLEPYDGLTIRVRFSNYNSYKSDGILLRLGGSSASSYYVYSNDLYARGNLWGSGETVTFSFESSHWVMGAAAAVAASASSTASEASALVNELDGYLTEWAYNGNKTYIDGSKIYTGTVVCNKLFGNAISIYGSSSTSSTIYGYMYAGTNSAGTTALELFGVYGARLKASSNIHIESSSSNMTFQSYYDDDEGEYKPSIGVGGYVYPKSNGSHKLGMKNLRWKEIWCTQSSINSSSDRNEKKDITYNMDVYDSFFDSLKPTPFKYIDGESGRTHLGMISQDVEEALVESNLTALDFAGFLKDKKEIVTFDEKTGDIHQEQTEEYCYGLRYTEFIALCVDQIQKLKKRVSELEKNN